MDKAFCSTCRWYKQWIVCTEPNDLSRKMREECHHPLNERYCVSYYSDFKKPFWTPREHNATNDCQEYEKKRSWLARLFRPGKCGLPHLPAECMPPMPKCKQAKTCK